MHHFMPFFLALYFGQSAHTYFSFKYLENFNPGVKPAVDWYNLL